VLPEVPGLLTGASGKVDAAKSTLCGASSVTRKLSFLRDSSGFGRDEPKARKHLPHQFPLEILANRDFLESVDAVKVLEEYRPVLLQDSLDVPRRDVRAEMIGWHDSGTSTW